MKEFAYRIRTLTISRSGTWLLETLLASSIMLTLFPIFILKAVPAFEHQQMTQFIESLTQFLEDAQLAAFTNHRKVYIEFDNNKHEVFSFYSTFERLNNLSVPSFVQVEKGSLPLNFYFSSSGGISQAGTLLIRSKNETYQITFLLGQGRFYVTQK
ncbi:competence type IV pilus minor pilin ComGD [Pullulanibacillus sp. KACC 23026]|uniref:competence type IV pilus minor pilin ComGD n=1 Tax=Pullulanibacillus sp. KACC 23026 TaxID=3028315 RepID=UPI0023B15B62|nr:competence type IV pilus minor pilin ComGD [Pullulanibacillus sp. KACC 23026]WEG14288.1 competence type IV pilus minor pilin ComGD [Pullulanibacillus sp. KACC 23026]